MIPATTETRMWTATFRRLAKHTFAESADVTRTFSAPCRVDADAWAEENARVTGTIIVAWPTQRFAP